MKTLVLGGTYFIGKVLIQKLLKLEKYQITALNRGTKQKEMVDSTESINVDRTDASVMANALCGKKFDVVFDISGYNKDDVQIALSALNKNFGHYIFCSSVAVCQQPPKFWPLTEDHPKCISIADGEYGFKKWQAESFLWQKSRETGFNFIIVRPVYVYGPHNYHKREMHVFERVSSGLPIIIDGNGENIIQFGYVDDLVDAMITMAGNSLAYGESFNISGKELITVNNFIHLAADVINKDVKIIHADPQDSKFPAKDFAKFPNVHRFSNISKSRNVLGIEPKVNLLEGLRKTAQWWQKRKELL